MNRLHIVGRKNHGKTTLLVSLIEALTGFNYRVGAIKHTHHAHQLDVPGKDSHRFGTAGAAGVGILSRDQSAYFWPSRRAAPSADFDPYAQFEEMFAACDLVLVEGDTQTQGKKIEVWRAQVGGAPLASTDESILAVVSDDQPPVTCAIWKRCAVSEIALKVMELVGVVER